MPVQRFAPMTKDFATFDCDAHVTEPPLIWERAKDFLTRDELDALKQTIWWDAESRLLIVNGRAGVGLGSPRKGGDRKSTRLNSSHRTISYAVFCLKKQKLNKFLIPMINKKKTQNNKNK